MNPYPVETNNITSTSSSSSSSRLSSSMNVTSSSSNMNVVTPAKNENEAVTIICTTLPLADIDYVRKITKQYDCDYEKTYANLMIKGYKKKEPCQRHQNYYIDLQILKN